jgi:hypothetical protein
MSKKDYVAIAEAIMAVRQVPAPPPNPAVRSDDAWLNGAEFTSTSIAKDVAAYCGEANQKFDKARFLKACGVIPA